jgi:hypothetical protein
MSQITPIFQFIITMVLITGCIETGYYLGRKLQGREKSEDEKMISVICASILGLMAFMMGFTFGIVSARYDTRKSLVREEANQIRTVWLRTDFMPEPDRSASRKLLKQYLGLRLVIIKNVTDKDIVQSVVQGDEIQEKLWALSEKHSRTDMQTDIGALYFDALNKLIDLQGLRFAIGYQARLPKGLWIALYILLVLSMLSIGYYAAIIKSRRNFSAIILSFSFALVLVIISMLDQVQTNQFGVTQQPLIDLQYKLRDK